MRNVSPEEAAQARKVNEAYALTGNCNPDYEREFGILSEMRMSGMAGGFRSQRGLPPNAKTPYDR